MNDDQKKKLDAVLAAAFDEAATKCPTMEAASSLIQFRLAQNGFAVVMRK